MIYDPLLGKLFLGQQEYSSGCHWQYSKNQGCSMRLVVLGVGRIDLFGLLEVPLQKGGMLQARKLNWQLCSDCQPQQSSNEHHLAFPSEHRPSNEGRLLFWLCSWALKILCVSVPVGSHPSGVQSSSHRNYVYAISHNSPDAYNVPLIIAIG